MRRKTRTKSLIIEVTNSQNECLSPAHVEREYKIPQSTQKAQRWARLHNKKLNQGIEFIKCGRKVLYRRAAIEKYLESQTVTSTK